MPDAGFIELLRCPETRQKLTVAPPELLERLRAEQTAGKLFCKSGKPLKEPIDAGLVREDGLVLYPVRNGIPVMIKDEAVVLIPGA